MTLAAPPPVAVAAAAIVPQLLRASVLLCALGVAAAGPRTISVFGSSVADGAFCSGNCSGRNLSAVTPAEGLQGGCYQSRLRVHQASTVGQGRDVFNNCHGGDTTTKLLDRYYQLIDAKPRYVLIGLSLANEGIIAGGQPIFDHYVAGMQTLMTQNKQHGFHTYVGSNYANSNYNLTHYKFIKDMNILTQTWNVPSCNFLGTIDNGKGQWVPGFVASAGHPNNEGQTEMYHSIVPSIWDAIDDGKKPLAPKRPKASARSAVPSARAAVTYTVPKTEPIHSYAVVFRFRSTKIKSNSTITLLTINATDLDGAEYTLAVSMVPGHKVCGFGCHWQNPAFEYNSPIGGVSTSHGISSNDTMYDDGEWHEVALSHFWANQSTNLFMDGEQIGQLEAERVNPSSFTLAATTGTDGTPMTTDLHIYRSALNSDEVLYLYQGNTYQSSLEVWAPLDGKSSITTNLAQSMTELSTA